jgi:hypothetical protein
VALLYVVAREQAGQGADVPRRDRIGSQWQMVDLSNPQPRKPEEKQDK